MEVGGRAGPDLSESFKIRYVLRPAELGSCGGVRPACVKSVGLNMRIQNPVWL